jgi:hypothetical protein
LLEDGAQCSFRHARILTRLDLQAGEPLPRNGLLMSSTAEVGMLGELTGERAFRRLGYSLLPSKLDSNNGFDRVWMRGSSQDPSIVIVESKFPATGYARLGET